MLHSPTSAPTYKARTFTCDGCGGCKGTVERVIIEEDGLTYPADSELCEECAIGAGVI